MGIAPWIDNNLMAPKLLVNLRADTPQQPRFLAFHLSIYTRANFALSMRNNPFSTHSLTFYDLRFHKSGVQSFPLQSRLPRSLAREVSYGMRESERADCCGHTTIMQPFKVRSNSEESTASNKGLCTPLCQVRTKIREPS